MALARRRSRDESRPGRSCGSSIRRDSRSRCTVARLTPLVSSLGTPYAFDPPARSILFIEDVGERPYRIDRMLTQLRLSGVLERAAGLVFGEMRSCDEPGGAVTARDVDSAAHEGLCTVRSSTDFPQGIPQDHAGRCRSV